MAKETNPLKHFFINMPRSALVAGIFALFLGLSIGAYFSNLYQAELQSENHRIAGEGLVIYANSLTVTVNSYFG